MSDTVINQVVREKRYADTVLNRRTALVAVTVAVGYYVSARIGFAFTFQPGSVSILWIPNSILMAALLLSPTRSWWLLLVTTLPAHFAAELQSGVPATMVLCWFLSNCSQALIAAGCIRALTHEEERLETFSQVSVFIMFGAFLAPFLSSFLDIAFVKLNHWGRGNYWELWRVRFFANVLSTLTLVPLALSWLSDGFDARFKVSRLRLLEAGALALGILIISVLVFWSSTPETTTTQSLLYWPLGFLLWAAVRFGLRGVSAALAVVMFFAIFAAIRGRGPFVVQAPIDNALSIQLFLIVAAIPLLSLAALIKEREQAVGVAQHNEEQLAMALNAAQMGTWDWNIRDNRVRWSDQTKRIFGVSSNEPESPEAFYGLMHPGDRALVREAVRRSVSDGSPYEAEFRISQPSGAVRWVRAKGKVLNDEATGKPLRLIGLNADITETKQTQQALQESSSRNRAMLRALPDIVFLLSSDGVYLDYHTRSPESLLVPPEQFLGRTVRDVLPRDLAERVMYCLERAGLKDQPQVLEYPLTLAGDDRHFEARFSGIDGDRVLVIVRDVTDRYRASVALKKSEEKLRQSYRQVRALAGQLITAQEAERRRIARQLHDDWSQKIAALSIAISKLKRALPLSAEKLAAELDQLRTHTNDLTNDIRRLSHQLRPAVLEHLGLVAALESYVNEFREETNIAVSINARIGSEEIPLETSVCLYRVALEALRNVARHSGSPTATISLTIDDGTLRLEIRDSGVGFDVGKALRGGGLGLIGAEERVKLLQGDFEIRSGPDTGTTVRACIPLGV